MKIAAQTAGIPIHLGCFAHTLNLASGCALDVKEVHSLLAKIRSIVSFMHRSTTAAALLTKKQSKLQLPPNKLIIDIHTSWNSSYLIVERFLKQQVAIIATLTDETMKKQREAKSVQAGILGQHEIQHCEQFLKLMEPMYQATIALSADQSPTVRLIVPLLPKLKSVYSEHTEDNTFQEKIRAPILQDLDKRYRNEDLIKFLEEATALDPRIKDKAPDAAWDRFTDKLVSILTQTYVEVKVDPVTSTSSEHETSTLPVVPDLLRATAADVKQESPSPAKQMKKTALTFLLDDDGNLYT